MSSRVRYLCRTALFALVALALSYIEFLLPPVLPLPGVKLGLANLVTAYLIRRDKRQAATVSALRLALNALLFGSVTALFFSVCGAVLSFAVMALLDCLFSDRMTHLGLCAAGGVMHNVGQLCAAALLFGVRAALSYATPLMLAGLVCGIIIGAVLNLFSERITTVLVKTMP